VTAQQEVPLLTEEDGQCWLCVLHRYPSTQGGVMLRFMSSVQDRRDAAIMLEARENNAVVVETWRMGNHSHSVWWDFHVGGWAHCRSRA
jgi:hypothetical protein